MGLFDKKYCDICGEKIGLLGNKKLDDGNCCKDCVSKLSPWFTGRKKSSVAQIKEQLAYREANKAEVENFHTTKTFGTNTKLHIDEDAGKFCVTSASNLQNANPDILDYSMVTGCVFDITDSKRELMTKDAEGKEVSYKPARYEVDYNFYITIQVNHPWFDEMRFQINSSSVEVQGIVINPNSNPDYGRYKTMGEEIKAYVENMRQGIRDAAAAAAAPKQPVKCPFCGATTIPQNGCCEYCGGPVA